MNGLYYVSKKCYYGRNINWMDVIIFLSDHNWIDRHYKMICFVLMKPDVWIIDASFWGMIEWYVIFVYFSDIIWSTHRQVAGLEIVRLV